MDKKAKASGRETDPSEEYLKKVDSMYGKKRPESVVDEFLAERSKLWGEAPGEGGKPPLEFRELSQEEIDGMDDLQRMVWEMYGRKLPVNEVDQFIADRR